MRLSGGLRYAPIFSHRYIMLFNFDPIGIRRQSLLLLRCGQRDVQDAILELCVDGVLLHIAHIEAAGAAAGEGLAAQVAAVLIFLIVRVAADSLNGQVAIVQFHLNVFLLAAGQVNGNIIVPIGSLLHIGLHHVCTCARSFYVGDAVKKEDIHAKFEDGILHITLPAPQQQKALPENPNLIAIE